MKSRYCRILPDTTGYYPVHAFTGKAVSEQSPGTLALSGTPNNSVALSDTHVSRQVYYVQRCINNM
eukprot:1221748-Amorphochlora_amoeboformis.AAC.1